MRNRWFYVVLVIGLLVNGCINAEWYGLAAQLAISAIWFVVAGAVEALTEKRP